MCVCVHVELVTYVWREWASPPLPYTILRRGLFGSGPKVVSATLHEVVLDVKVRLRLTRVGVLRADLSRTIDMSKLELVDANVGVS